MNCEDTMSYEASLEALKNAAEACDRAAKWTEGMGMLSVATDCRQAKLLANDTLRRLQERGE